MDIDKIIDSTIKDSKPAAGPGDDLESIPLKDLLTSPVLNDDLKFEIYNRFKDDINKFIDNYLLTSKDPRAAEGMYKCSFETWQACVTNIGLYYFRKNKYLKDVNRIAIDGGVSLRDDLLSIGIELYEALCMEYRKQFFLYDCTRFLGINKDMLYKLSDLHALIVKKAHTMQEASLRSNLISGRSNVTAALALLNHDYNYTKTTEIIHHTTTDKTADRLPDLSDNMLTLDDNL